MTFILGTLFGSFFCLVAQRVPQNRSILFPASHCDFCQHPLTWVEKIPIFSILWQKFRCRNCQHKLSVHYLLAEITCGLLFYWCLTNPSDFNQWRQLFWLASVFVLVLTDIFYMVVEPKIFYPSVMILWLWQLLNQQPIHFTTVIYCLVITFIFLLFFREKFGFGDILLLLSWSPWIPLTDFALLLVGASCLGLLLFAILPQITQKPMQELPFVPCLGLALTVTLLV
ncbi:MAG: prepilin peptidase [Enterococcus sp.]